MVYLLLDRADPARETSAGWLQGGHREWMALKPVDYGTVTEMHTLLVL
jgi:hypothetical protein